MGKLNFYTWMTETCKFENALNLIPSENQFQDIQCDSSTALGSFHQLPTIITNSDQTYQELRKLC
jgi:hypothetical protein